ncbi:hypothetical protein AB0G00_24105 [Nocardia salmonicida]|uniref:hypothetical protein n=1 Tax=Nocardia salmonicida TaxID=53431 RepID=UPI0033DBFBF5
MLTFEAWHPTSAEALICAVADALENSPGSTVAYTDDFGQVQQAWISSFQEVGGPVSQPDPDVLDADRWTYTARLGIATNI